MVSEHWLKQYCTDPEKIENYDKAIADTENVWECHHRRESIFSREGLIEIGEYWHRPPEELILLTQSDHNSLHFSGKELSDHTKIGISKALKGKKLSKRHKSNIGLSHVGVQTVTGYKWYNNGKIERIFKSVPGPEWKRGRL